MRRCRVRSSNGSIDASTKVIAYSIVTGLLAAHIITGDKIATTLAWVSLLVAGDPDAGHIEIDGTISPPEIRLYGPTGELAIRMNGDENYFNGDVIAQTLTLIGPAEIRGDAHVTKTGSLTLNSRAASPHRSADALAGAYRAADS